MPGLIKPSRMSFLGRSVFNKGRGVYFVGGALLFDLIDPNTILTEQALWQAVADQVPPGSIFDEAAAKPFAEVLVAGSAIPPGAEPVRALAVEVRVGTFAKRLRVYGDRRWVMGDHGPVFTSPVPFDHMPLVAERAFGGPGFDANPAGVGADAADRLGARGEAPLPNIETWDDQILQIETRPRPALIGPLPGDAPQRLRLMGSTDGAYLKESFPGFPDDFDVGYFNVAPHDQILSGYLRGDEEVIVSGMSSKHPTVQSRLPGLRARAFLVPKDKPDTLREVRLNLDTVWLFGSINKGAVIFHGAAHVEDPEADDIAYVMLAYERLYEPRDLAHYQSVFRLRTEGEDRVKYVLADYQLAPLISDAERAERVKQKHAAFYEAQKRFTDMQAFVLHKELKRMGMPPELWPAIEPPKMPPVAIPTREEMERGEGDFAQLLDDMAEMERFGQAVLVKGDEILKRMIESTGAPLPATMVKPEDVGLDPAARHPDAEALGQDLESEDFGQLVKLFDDSRDELTRQLELGGLAQPDVDFDDYRKLLTGEALIDATNREDPEDAFQKARARALDLPEGSPLFEMRQSLAKLDPASMPLPPALPAGMTLDDVMRMPPPARDKTPIKDLVAGGGRAEADAADAEAALGRLRKAGGKLAKTFPALASEDPADTFDSLLDAFAAGAEAADTSQSLTEMMAAVPTMLDEAERTVIDSTRSMRRTAPAATAPAPPLTPDAAIRLGTVAREEIGFGNLAGRDLAGADLSGADLSGCDLTGTLLEKANLQGTRLVGAILDDAALTGANLERADLTDASLRRTNLSQANLHRASLHGARLSDTQIVTGTFDGAHFKHATLENVVFLTTSLKHTNFKKAQISASTFLRCAINGAPWRKAHGQRLTFIECDFGRHAVFHGARLDETGFIKCQMPGADWSRAVLHKSGFVGESAIAHGNWRAARLWECGFMEQDLEGSDFTHARIMKSTLVMCSALGARFRLARLRECTVMRSNLNGCDLVGADLYRTVLHRSKLRRASLRGASLYNCDFGQAKLLGADLTHANIDGTVFTAPAVLG